MISRNFLIKGRFWVPIFEKYIELDPAFMIS